MNKKCEKNIYNKLNQNNINSNIDNTCKGDELATSISKTVIPNSKNGGVNNQISWADKYLLSLQEEVTYREIMQLRSCGHQTALEIRKKAIEYCIENSIEYSMRKVPTIAVLKVIGHDIDYYYEKMIQEHKFYDLKGVKYVDTL